MTFERLAKITLGVWLLSIPARADIVGFGGGTLNFQNGAPSVSADNGKLTLTTNAGGETTSWFYNTPQNAAEFSADFTYTVSGARTADGAVFVLQNDPRGASALGGSGGQLGYVGIRRGAGVALNLFFNPGSAFVSDAASLDQAIFNQVYPVVLISGDAIQIHLAYDAGALTETLFDRSNGSRFTLQYAVDLASILGGPTAYVGFTGGTGQFTSVQTISDFSFNGMAEIPEPGTGWLAALAMVAAASLRVIGKPGRIGQRRRVETRSVNPSAGEYPRV